MAARDFDAVIVGAGFAGLYMLHRLRGMGFKARVLEAGSGVGGTWYWNRYPGARCDVESVQYSYQFDDALQQEWEWSERYAAQPELLRYANHVADRFDLRRDIQFNTRVKAAAFDEAQGRWVLETSDGARVTATFCIMATGCLSSPNLPQFEGLDSFAGRSLPHRLLAARGRRFHAASGSPSSAPARRPCSRSRSSPRRPSTCTCSSARPTTRCPRTTRRSIPTTCAQVKADYPALRARAKQTMTGIDFDYSRPGGAGDLAARRARASTSGAGGTAGCGSSAPTRT